MNKFNRTVKYRLSIHGSALPGHKMVEKKMVYKTWSFTSVFFFGEQINKELTLYCRHTICPGSFLLLWQTQWLKGAREEWTPPNHSPSMGCQDKNSSRSLEARTEAVYGLAPCNLLILLCYTIQGHLPRMASPTVSWALLHQSLIQKMPQQTCLQVSLMESIPHWLSLSQDDSSLCQGHTKQHTILCIPHQQVNLREQPQHLFLLTNHTFKQWNMKEILTEEMKETQLVHSFSLSPQLCQEWAK